MLELVPAFRPWRLVAGNRSRASEERVPLRGKRTPDKSGWRKLRRVGALQSGCAASHSDSSRLRLNYCATKPGQRLRQHCRFCVPAAAFPLFAYRAQSLLLHVDGWFVSSAEPVVPRPAIHTLRFTSSGDSFLLFSARVSPFRPRAGCRPGRDTGWNTPPPGSRTDPEASESF